MAESKAIPMNIVVSDKGRKSVRIGKGFAKLASEKGPHVSLTISLEALRAALADKTVTEQPYRSNEAYPDSVLDGKNVLRIACFKITKISSI